MKSIRIAIFAVAITGILTAVGVTWPPFEYYPYVAETGDNPPLNYTKVCLPGAHGESAASYVMIGIPHPVRKLALAQQFDGDLIIPPEIDGLPVRKIMPGAFIGCSHLTSVSVPSSVREIGDKAFLWCTNLKKITFGEGLQTIGEYAFSNCVSLAKVELPASLAYIGRGCFSRCNSLKDVSFNGNAPQIDVKTPLREPYLGEKFYFGAQSKPRFKVRVREGSLGWATPYSAAIPEYWPTTFGLEWAYEVVVDGF